MKVYRNKFVKFETFVIPYRHHRTKSYEEDYWECISLYKSIKTNKWEMEDLSFYDDTLESFPVIGEINLKDCILPALINELLGEHNDN